MHTFLYLTLEREAKDPPAMTKLLSQNISLIYPLHPTPLEPSKGLARGDTLYISVDSF